MSNKKLESQKVDKMKQNYEFFLFSQLVNDEILHRNNIHIPYDTLFSIMLKHFEIYKVGNVDFSVSEYESILAYIETSPSLMSELMAVNEG